MVAGISLPDPNDRHVVAAALQGRADMVVTANVRDFPTQTGTAGFEVQHPVYQSLKPARTLERISTIATLHRQAAATRRPAITTKILLDHLAMCGAPKFAATAAGQLWRDA